MKKGYLLIPALVLSLITTPLVYAKDGDGGGDDRGSRVEVRENMNEGVELNEATESESSPSPSPFSTSSHIEINANNFMVRGTVDSIGSNSFIISGQQIVIDPTQVKEFEQRGVLAVGNEVLVTGAVINGTNFAREITSFGSQGQLKVEVKNNPSSSPSVKVKASGSLATTFLAQIQKFLGSLFH